MNTNKKTLTLGLFGFGCVGQGLWDVLHSTPGIKAEIQRICVKDRTKQRPLSDTLTAEKFTFDADDILRDESIDVVVELIDDASSAYTIVKTALQHGKAVVSANKKMIAEHLEELLVLQQEFNAPLLYEAAVGGSIPIIRLLEEYYDNDMLRSVDGIINGTTNYILTKMASEGQSYDTALKNAQALGFAESNPFLDVSGTDARNKTSIVCTHAFGVVVQPENILTIGIENVTNADIRFANNQGCEIKLIASIKRNNSTLTAVVAPTFVPRVSQLASVRNEFNGIELQAAFSDTQFLLGRGAGSHPTASAVLSDISALTYQYKYEYKKCTQSDIPEFSNEHEIQIYARFKDEHSATEFPFTDIVRWFTIRADGEEQEGTIVIGSVEIEELQKVLSTPEYSSAKPLGIILAHNIIEKTNDVSIRAIHKKKRMSGVDM
jgi:homoserine dehydrogenase